MITTGTSNIIELYGDGCEAKIQSFHNGNLEISTENHFSEKEEEEPLVVEINELQALALRDFLNYCYPKE